MKVKEDKSSDPEETTMIQQSEVAEGKVYTIDLFQTLLYSGLKLVLVKSFNRCLWLMIYHSVVKTEIKANVSYAGSSFS